MNYRVDPQAPVTVEKLIVSLAEMCDGAAQRDHSGFSGADVEFGHSLAGRARAARAFTPKQADSALKMLTKYRRQLGGADFIREFVQAPVWSIQPLGAESQPAPAPAPKQARVLSSQNSNAVLKFGYDSELVAEIKTLRGEHRGRKFWASWDSTNRVWTLPVNGTSIHPLMQLARKWQFEIEQRFLDYLAQVEETTQESRMMLTLNSGVHVTVAEDSILIAVDDALVLKEFERALGI